MKKIKNLIKRNLRLSVAIIFLLILVGSAYAFTKPNKITSSKADLIATDENLLENYFKNIRRYDVAGATKTVIYIPQIHKEPTTEASNSKNDYALKVQKEIFQSLQTLGTEFEINYVMDETDLYGPMPTDKITKIKDAQSEIARAKDLLETIISEYKHNGGNETVVKTFAKEVNKRIDNTERRIYLTGAAAVYASTDSGAKVYGSQNPATINKSRDMLRNIVFLENRIAQLEKKNVNKYSASSQESTLGDGDIVSLFSRYQHNSTNGSRSMANFAEKNNLTNLQNDISALDKSLNKLENMTDLETGSTVAANVSNSNPFENSNDLASLKKEYQKQYADFMKVAKDQRSAEVSENISNLMEKEKISHSVLLFGAEHKDQIVEGLNNKGINVIVLTPESVVDYYATHKPTT